MSILTKHDLSDFKERLLQRAEWLKAQIAARHQEEMTQSTIEVHRMGDDAADRVNQEIRAELDERQIAELNEIHHALQRINESQYGVCEDCGMAIGLARLNAFPMAKRCLECKIAYERQTEMA